MAAPAPVPAPGAAPSPAQSHPLPYCRVTPLPDQQYAFQIAEREVTRWCFSPAAPRPYFYPVNGPSGHSLTRMGHPGAPNHDHHRSLWFAHNDLIGQDFWAENKPPRITQSQWYAIEDEAEFARLALELRWTDGHDPRPLLKHDLFMTVRPLSEGEWTLELQSNFRSDAEGIEFRQNNFGILGLRVTKSLSAVFGAGKVTGADGGQGEPALFGKPNRWLDYSGPILRELSGEFRTEGMTLIDHARNPAHPAKWHVRDDGWIGPSLSRDAAVPVRPGEVLTVRYLLYVHKGAVKPAVAAKLADEFDQRPSLGVAKGTKPHHQWQIIEAR